jgi:hypothetical protein
MAVVQNARRALVIALSLSSPKAAAAQILVQSSTVVSSSVRGIPKFEPFLAVSSRNPRTLLASTFAMYPEGPRPLLYVSHDGGARWSRVQLPKGKRSPWMTAGDPSVYFDAAGIAYFAANNRDGLWVSTSTDDGRNWSLPREYKASQHLDRPYLAFDRSNRFKGRVYAGAYAAIHPLTDGILNGLGVAFSDDTARTWTQTYLVSNMSGAERTLSFTNMLAAPNGSLIAPFTTNMESTPEDSVEWGQWRALFSRDGGKTFRVSSSFAPFSSPAKPPRSAGRFAAGSAAIDLSNSSYRGRAYVVYGGLSASQDRMDILVSWSDDDGERWSTPVMINDNVAPGDHVNPAIAVNNKGVVAVTWNDRRRHRGTCYDVYASASVDGGVSWGPNARLSGAPTCPNSRGNWVVSAEFYDYWVRDWRRVFGITEDAEALYAAAVPTRWANGGDTQGLDAGSDGVFHAAWIDGKSGTMELAHTAFRVTARVVAAVGRVPSSSVSVDTNADASVAAQIKMVMEKCGFDWNASTYTCKIHLENRSGLEVEGPVAVSVMRSFWNWPGLRLVSSDSGGTDVGATWYFASLSGKPRFAPGDKSVSRTIAWRFDSLGALPSAPFVMFAVRRSNVHASP